VVLRISAHVSPTLRPRGPEAGGSLCLDADLLGAPNVFPPSFETSVDRRVFAQR
jgi:hypothetical protein